MDGSVNKTDELRNALIIFADEAIGFRKSLHHFHRWLETKDNNNKEARRELEALFLEIGRENYIDLWPILNCINDGKQIEGIVHLHKIAAHGIYLPRAWSVESEVRLLPLEDFPFAVTVDDQIDLQSHVSSIWKFRDWINQNNEKHSVDSLTTIAYMHQLLVDAREDFLKAFELIEMLFGHKTLASTIIDSSVDFFGLVVGNNYYARQKRHIAVLSLALKKYPDLNWKDALSRNQVRSKLWLLEKIKDLDIYTEKRKAGDPEVTTIIVGGWVGLLPYLATMLGIKLGATYNVDIDTSVHGAATELNYSFNVNFRNSADDIRTYNIKRFPKAVVIDTIVEHFKDHGDWVKTLPANATVVLQGNDMFHVPDHVNCHASYEEFIDSCGLTKIEWHGELPLDNCTRYMAIGHN